MICDVLLTKKDNKFIARVCQHPDIVAEDHTEKGALMKTQAKLKNLLSNAKIVRIDTESEPDEHPWLKHAGMFADDPNWDVFQEFLNAYREEIDSDTIEL